MRYVEVKCSFGGPDPGPPKPGEMQVFCDERDVPLMVDFLCPCGCGRACATHLLEPGQVKKPNDHHWEFERGPNGVTLRPSIRWRGGCKAHFFITDGEAKMCADSGK